MNYYEYYEALIPNENTRLTYFQNALTKMILHWPNFINQPEIKDNKNWTYCFEFIKKDLIYIISEFCPLEKKEILKKNTWDLKFKNILYDELVRLNKE